MSTKQSQAYFQAIASRDARFDGRFFYGVRTTGVYCRPTCASRTPLAQNVEFFDSSRAAERASYRACKRCKPDALRPDVDERFLRVCREIETAEEAPSLRKLASLVGLSEFHLQRRFKAALGVTPRQYAERVKHDRLRGALQNGKPVTQAIFEAGYRSLSQAYGKSPGHLGMTPSQYRAGGRDASVTYAIVDSPLGRVLIAATSRGICRVDIDKNAALLEKRLFAEFPNAAIGREKDALVSAASLVVAYLFGSGPWPELPLDLRASAFQTRVWEALRAISPGSKMTYSQLAKAIGSPGAARAVARACAANPVALLIPCHRIVPQAGGVGGYRWGPERKRRLLELERAGK